MRGARRGVAMVLATVCGLGASACAGGAPQPGGTSSTSTTRSSVVGTTTAPAPTSGSGPRATAVPTPEAPSGSTSTSSGPPSSTLPSSPTTAPDGDIGRSPSIVTGAYELPPGTEVPIGAGVHLRLVAITEDSRCPADAQCVWTGDLAATVAWTNGNATAELDLRWSVHAAPTPSPAPGFSLALDDAVGGAVLVQVGRTAAG